MNIFRLDDDPFTAACYHSDSHVLKMLVETAQLMSTAHRFLDGDKAALRRIPTLMFGTHVNHPCSVWVRACRDNYEWAGKLMFGLLAEYDQRFGKGIKRHKLTDLVSALVHNVPYCVPSKSLLPVPLCMPSAYHGNNPVTSYRLYYFYEKKHLAHWRAPATVPEWWRVLEQNSTANREVNGHAVV